MKMSETIGKISPALVKAQSAMGGALKDANNPFFKSKYADLSAVMEACKKPLNDNGIVVLQGVGIDSHTNIEFVETTLLHESGEFVSERMKIVLPKDANNPQAYGSAISYAKRYSLQALVFLPSVDDDGEASLGRTAPQQDTKSTAKDTTEAPKASGAKSWKSTKATTISTSTQADKVPSTSTTNNTGF